MKDYYKILGVKEDASDEEIRSRWVELIKHYHPDLGKTDEEGDKKIKEINEAYEVLKDESKRFDYDLERVLKRSLVKKIESRKQRMMDIQKIILPAGILVLCLIVAIVIFTWFRVAVPPKSEVLYEIDKVLEKKSTSEVPPAKKELSDSVPKGAPGETKKEVTSQESPKIVSTPTPPPRAVASTPSSASLSPAEKERKPREEVAPQVVMKTEMTAKPELPKGLPKEISKEVPKEIHKEVAKEVPKEIPKEVPKEAPKDSREVPKEIDQVLPKESVKTDQPKPAVTESPPPSKPEIAAKVEQASPAFLPPPPPFAKEDEVEHFFADYRDRYSRKDVDRFLSLFSTRALQNKKDGFDGIRKIYTNFFGQSQELKLRLDDTKIEIYQNFVEVRARFRVDQILKKRGEKVWRGDIRWVLTREEGALKILSLDYRNEKSP